MEPVERTIVLEVEYLDGVWLEIRDNQRVKVFAAVPVLLLLDQQKHLLLD